MCGCWKIINQESVLREVSGFYLFKVDTFLCPKGFYSTDTTRQIKFVNTFIDAHNFPW